MDTKITDTHNLVIEAKNKIELNRLIKIYRGLNYKKRGGVGMDHCPGIRRPWWVMMYKMEVSTIIK